MKVTKSLIELPKKGKALVVTDIHGNLTDFEKYMRLWDGFKGKNNHLTLSGDFIHGISNAKDDSLKILDMVKQHCEQEENFHALLGNHEWVHVSGEDVFKMGVNQKLKLELHLKMKFWSGWKRELNKYVEFFKKLPLAVKTENGVFISHAAPVKNINDINDIINITDDGYLPSNKNLYEILWNRHPENYNTEDIDLFLKKVSCRFSVVGHTPVDGYKIIGNQLILSSSLSTGRKCYLELDLEKDVNDVECLTGMIKELK